MNYQFEETRDNPANRLKNVLLGYPTLSSDV